MGFVSNSSSSSFVVVNKDFLSSNNKDSLTKEEKLKLINFGFQITDAAIPLHILIDGMNNGGMKDVLIEKDSLLNDCYYGYYVDCNQIDVSCFLLKNNISYKAVTHYGDDTEVFNKDDKYFHILHNFSSCLLGKKINREEVKRHKKVTRIDVKKFLKMFDDRGVKNEN